MPSTVGPGEKSITSTLGSQQLDHMATQGKVRTLREEQPLRIVQLTTRTALYSFSKGTR